jgi:hypothetical protein
VCDRIVVIVCARDCVRVGSLIHHSPSLRQSAVGELSESDVQRAVAARARIALYALPKPSARLQVGVCDACVIVIAMLCARKCWIRTTSNVGSSQVRACVRVRNTCKRICDHTTHTCFHSDLHTARRCRGAHLVDAQAYRAHHCHR